MYSEWNANLIPAYLSTVNFVLPNFVVVVVVVVVVGALHVYTYSSLIRYYLNFRSYAHSEFRQRYAHINYRAQRDILIRPCMCTETSRTITAFNAYTRIFPSKVRF
uniref:Uncharacterized protein n=1 Tax=Trichogramma kaykai TaxID=54128 RepID=A0ABD2WKH5_9HYME